MPIRKTQYPFPQRNVLRLLDVKGDWKGDWSGTPYSMSYASRNSVKKIIIHPLIRERVYKVIVPCLLFDRGWSYGTAQSKISSPGPLVPSIK